MEIIVTHPKSKTAFKIFSDDEDLIEYFKLFYLNIDEPTAKNYEHIHYIYHHKCYIIFDSLSVRVLNESPNLTINKFIRKHMVLYENWAAYHGTSILVNGKVYLLLGKSGAGKTTLSTYFCVKKNAVLLSEDITIVNCKTLEVAPFGRYISLRKDGMTLLQQKYDCKFSIKKKIYNNKYLIEIPQKYDENGVYKLYRCFILNRDNNIATPLIQRNMNVLDYILNSYSEYNMLLNIVNAQHLRERNLLYILIYHNLEQLYELMATPQCGE